MSERNQYLLLSLLILLLVSGMAAWRLGLISFKGKEEEPPSQPEEKTRSTEEAIVRAINEKDSSLCNEIEDERDRETCVTQVITTRAIEEDDPSLCDEIEKEAKASLCRDSVLLSRALREGDAETCSGIQSEEVRVRCGESLR